MRRRRRQRQIRLTVFITIAIVFVIIIAIYLGFTFYFRDHFFFRTEINGMKVGGMTATEAEQKVSTSVDDYLLTIFDRDDNKHHIRGKDLGCKYISDDTIQGLLNDQKIFGWPKFIFQLQEKEMNIALEYDDEMLEKAVEGLALFQKDQIIKPENAYIIQEDSEFKVVPEVAGTKAKLKNVVKAVKEAVSSGKTETTLTDKDYSNPKVTTESSIIADAVETINKYLGTIVTYEFVEREEEVLDSTIIKDFIILSEDYKVSLDETKIEAYVQSLASKYNTYGSVRKFKTTNGDIVEIGGGDYGWIVHKVNEANAIKENIESGAVITRELLFSQRPFSEGLDEIGTTYLEIDYTNQHMWYYEEGELILESDVVTGRISRGWGSPDGVFKVQYKKSPDVLRGEDYESNVMFFIVYAFNVGVHDADWRNQFGGELYKNQGSHGCVNAPYEAAEKLYQTIQKDTPVIAYYREPVELTANNTKMANAYSYVNPEKTE